MSKSRTASFSALKGPLFRLDEVSSTQDETRRLLQNGAAAETAGALPRHLLSVSARFQSRGRGRRGRSWVTQRDAAVIISLAFAAELKHACRLGIQASLAVALCLERLGGARVRIKWPNDVLVDGRKIAGILLETFPFASHSAVVAGIGINVKGEAPPGGGSFGEFVPGVEVPEVLGRFLEEFDLVLARGNRLRELAEFNRRLILPRHVEAAGEVYNVRGVTAASFIAADDSHVCHIPFERVVDWSPMPHRRVLS